MKVEFESALDKNLWKTNELHVWMLLGGLMINICTRIMSSILLKYYTVTFDLKHLNYFKDLKYYLNTINKHVFSVDCTVH